MVSNQRPEHFQEQNCQKKEPICKSLGNRIKEQPAGWVSWATWLKQPSKGSRKTALVRKWSPAELLCSKTRPWLEGRLGVRNLCFGPARARERKNVADAYQHRKTLRFNIWGKQSKQPRTTALHWETARKHRKQIFAFTVLRHSSVTYKKVNTALVIVWNVMENTDRSLPPQEKALVRPYLEYRVPSQSRLSESK